MGLPHRAESSRIPPDDFTQIRTLKDRPYNFNLRLSGELTAGDKKTIWSIFEENMRSDYQVSSFGWHPRQKKAELFHIDSRFILVYDPSTNNLIGYTMFRFDTEETMEDGVTDNVVYCYEIQISSQDRRSGLGKELLQDLEAIGRKWSMDKVMLTVFKINSSAIQFYKKLGYQVDPISPSQVVPNSETTDGQPDDEGDDDDEEWEDENTSEDDVDYEIYSKSL